MTGFWPSAMVARILGVGVASGCFSAVDVDAGGTDGSAAIGVVSGVDGLVATGLAVSGVAGLLAAGGCEGSGAGLP